MGAIITSSTPAFMVIFARLLLKEQLTLKKGISVCLATIGVFLIVGVGDMNLSSKLGGISLIIAALTWALMSILVKRVPSDYSQIVVTTYSILVALIVLTPIVVAQLNTIKISQLTHTDLFGVEFCIWVLSQRHVDFYFGIVDYKCLTLQVVGYFSSFNP